MCLSLISPASLCWKVERGSCDEVTKKKNHRILFSWVNSVVEIVLIIIKLVVFSYGFLRLLPFEFHIKFLSKLLARRKRFKVILFCLLSWLTLFTFVNSFYILSAYHNIVQEIFFNLFLTISLQSKPDAEWTKGNYTTMKYFTFFNNVATL